MSAPLTVLLADDHAATLADVRAVLDDHPGFTVVAAEADAPAAVRAAVGLRPDVCLLDVHMPGGGLAATWEIAARLPATHIAMYTVCDQDADLRLALRAGASGYLLKEMDPARLAPALHDLVEGRSPIPRRLLPGLLREFRDPSSRRRGTAGPLPAGEPLTSREWQVLDALRSGLSTRQIAAELSVSPATVRFHVMSVVRKLGVGDRHEAVALFV